MALLSTSEGFSMSDLDERAPLVSERSTSFTFPSRQHQNNNSLIGINEQDGDEVELAFRSIGIDVLLRDVTLVESRTWSRATRRKPTLTCQSVSALWQHDKLHAVIATETEVIQSLFLAVSQRKVCAAGDVRFNTLAPVTDQCFGFVGRESITVPSLTVAQNLEFAINLLTRARPEWKREMVKITASFLELDRHRKTYELTVGEAFRLKLGMELIRDPAILFVVDPFVGMDNVTEVAAVDLLHLVARRLHKTVIVGTRTAPYHILNASETLALLGPGGRLLYSGRVCRVCDYFNQLHIRAAATPVRQYTPDHNTAVVSGHRTTPPHTAAYAQPAEVSPYRISSPLPLFDDGSPAMRAVHTEDSEAVRAEEDQDVVWLSLPSTAVDLAFEWSESEAQTMLYAAKFYDSAQHSDLLEALSRLQVGPGGVLSDAMGTSLPPQTGTRKLFILLHHDLRALRTSHEAHAALAHLAGGLLGLLALVLQLPVHDHGGAFNSRGILFVLFALPLLANHRYVGGIKSHLELFRCHRHCGLYGTLLFLIALILRMMIEYAVHAVILMVFCIWLVPHTPLPYGAVAGLLGLTHRLVLYLTVSVIPTHIDESRVALLYLTYATLASGYLLNLTTFPQWMSWGSTLRWGYAAGVKQDTAGRDAVCEGPSNTSYCQPVQDYLALQGVTGDSLGRSAWTLAMMCACCVIALAVWLPIDR